LGSLNFSLLVTSQLLPCLVQELYIRKTSEIAAKLFCLVHPSERKNYLSYEIFFKGNTLHKVTYLMPQNQVSRRVTDSFQCFRPICHLKITTTLHTASSKASQTHR